MENKQRLASLDILRGLDMWLLLMLGPIVQNVLRVVDSPALDPVRHQMDHVQWEGFVMWDIIMPLFMFMSGITIPFSMAKFKNGVKPGKEFYLKLLRRFVLLFVLGAVVQGNLLGLEWKMLRFFSNTLQAIAVGYVLSALVFVRCGRNGQIVWTALAFALYFLTFALTGMNLDPHENVAMLVDKAVLGSHMDGVSWKDGAWAYADWYHYTWVLSSLNFFVTVMLGCYAGQILKQGGQTGERKTLLLVLTGGSLIVLGLGMSPVFPIIKKIWSSSMTLYSGGICFLLIAATYYVVDVRGWSKGLNWLKYYGMNAITAYVISHVFNFSSLSNALFHGLHDKTGDWYSVIITVSNTFILFFILKHMYDKKVFLKV